MPFRSLLVGVDFGDASARAISIAGLIATRTHADSLRLVHAETFEAPPYFTAEQIAALEGERASQRAQAEQFLRRFGRQHTMAPFTVAIDSRPPIDAIIHHAAAADLVVMGTHGRHGPKRWWLGSVAERVLRESDRPLLVVRADGDAPHESIFRRIVLQASASLPGDRALDVASGLASTFGGTVVDARREPFEAQSAAPDTTMLAVAMPSTHASGPASREGERLIRSVRVPILFVPEIVQSVSGHV